MGMSIDEHIAQLKKLMSFHNGSYGASVKIAIEIMRKYQQLEDFARWVAVEVIDEEMWIYNYLAFAEIACRKLVQLGITQESDGEYSYEVVEDGNNRN